MFSNKTVRIMAVVIPLLLALSNYEVPSNVFLSLMTVMAFFSFYLSSQGDSFAHQSLRTTAMVAGACAVMTMPIVVFDAFYLLEEERSNIGDIFEALTMVTPYFIFFVSIGYGLFAAIKVARAWRLSSRVKRKKAAR